MSNPDAISNCPICSTAGTINNLDIRNGKAVRWIQCKRCGLFRIMDGDVKLWPHKLEALPARERKNKIGRLSAWLYRHQQEYQAEEKCLSNIWDIEPSAPPLAERSAILLKEIHRRSDAAGAMVEVDAEKDPSWLSVTWSVDKGDLNHLVEYLSENEEIHVKGRNLAGATSVVLRPKGLVRLEKISSEHLQTFIAMSFSEDLYPVFADGFRKAFDDTDYRPYRVGEEYHNEKIDDKILEEIKKSAFLVADLTEHRNGVYFEAGYAKGLGLPVIWTCRDDHKSGLHFDIRQYNCILWHGADDLREKLKNAIQTLFRKYD